MKTIISLAALLFLIFNGVAQQVDYPRLKADAERAYADGSYARANELYGKVDKSGLPLAEARWVEFRLADTLWRAQAATETADTTKFEEAQKQLEELIRVADKEEDRDVVWAEAHESLARFLLDTSQPNELGRSLAPLSAGARLVGRPARRRTRARERYLKIVFKAAAAATDARSLLLHLLRQLHPARHSGKCAEDQRRAENEKAHLHFLIAMTMRNTAGDWESRQRVSEEFEAALKARQAASGTTMRSSTMPSG